MEIWLLFLVRLQAEFVILEFYDTRLRVYCSFLSVLKIVEPKLGVFPLSLLLVPGASLALAVLGLITYSRIFDPVCFKAEMLSTLVIGSPPEFLFFLFSNFSLSLISRDSLRVLYELLPFNLGPAVSADTTGTFLSSSKPGVYSTGLPSKTSVIGKYSPSAWILSKTLKSLYFSS